MDEEFGLDATLAGTLIRRQFPRLAFTSVALLGEGYDSTAFDVDGRWVFRFPKRRDVERQLTTEMRLLATLVDDSPTALPRFCFEGEPSPSFPLRFAGYPKLPGMPALAFDHEAVSLTTLAPQLARFFVWLHGRPIDEARRMGVPEQALDSLVEELRSEALADFGLLDGLAADAPLEKWFAYLKAGPARRPPTSAVLLHGDFAAEHALVDPGGRLLTGIIDWSDACLGEPAIDVAGLLHWGGPRLADAVGAASGAPFGDGTLTTARFLAACRGVLDVAFGLERSRSAYVAGGLRALAWCAGGGGHGRFR